MHDRTGLLDQRFVAFAQKYRSTVRVAGARCGGCSWQLRLAVGILENRDIAGVICIRIRNREGIAVGAG